MSRDRGQRLAVGPSNVVETGSSKLYTQKIDSPSNFPFINYIAMKGYILDCAIGFLAGTVWIFIGNMVATSLMFRSSAMSIVVWLIPALLIFLAYSRLSVYKMTHSDSWKALLWSFGCFLFIGFFFLSYFLFGVILVNVYSRLW